MMQLTNHSPFYVAYLNSHRWSDFRKLAIANAGNRCERCRDLAFLEVHHKHYLTLGRETFDDVEVLCHSCHRIADEERREDGWSKRVIGWAIKVHGRFWSDRLDFDEVEEEFQNWLDRRNAA
jgi:5-methylcytosine-specific restriction endonuclease McrA